MRDPVLIIVCFVFLAACLRSRFAGAVAYWWFSFFRPQEWAWGDISSYRLPMIATILFIIPSLIQGYLPIPRHRITAFMLAFLALATLSEFAVDCVSLQFRATYWFDFMVMILATLTTVAVVKTMRQFIILTSVAGLCIAFHAGKAGLAAAVGAGGTFYGASTMGGAFSGSNAFALGSATFLFLNICIIMWSVDGHFRQQLGPSTRTNALESFGKLGLPVLSVGIAFNVIALFSRGSALAMVVGMGIWGLLSRVLKPRYLLPLTLVAALAIPFITLPEGYSDRLASAFAQEDNLDASAASRPFFWGIAMNMAKDFPLGVGPGCYNTMYNSYDTSGGRYGFFRTVHSSHFEALAEVGYLGLLIWLLLFFSSVRLLLRVRGNEALAAPGARTPIFHAANGLIAALLTYAAGSSFYALAYSPVIWFLFGLTVILANIQQSGSSTTAKAISE